MHLIYEQFCTFISNHREFSLITIISTLISRPTRGWQNS